jgi:hypothetical protein
MATIKISDLNTLTPLNSNTSNVFFVATDKESGVTGKISGTTLADGLYANNVLNVGNNAVLFPGVIGQFVGNNQNYLQVDLENNNANGSADYVITGDLGSDTIHYLDLGFQNSNANVGILYPNDGYLYVQGNTSNNPGGNLIIATTTQGRDIVFAQGGYYGQNVVAKLSYASGLQLLQKPITFADGTTQNTSSLSAGTYANGAFIQANAAFLVANTPTHVANSAALYANAAFIQANAAFLVANTPTHVANSAAIYANGAFIQANAAFLKANTPDAIANSAALYANGAFAKANSALANTSGTFAGNLSITGDLALLNGSLSSAGNMSVNGTMVLANSNFSATESAITIKATANVATPSNDGYMLHISGKQNTASRIIFDSYSVTGNAYAVVAGRTARGTVDSPLAAANGDILMRVSGNGHGGAGAGFTQFGVARIDIVATENYSSTNRGSQIQFWNCPIGSNTLQRIASFNGDSVTFTGIVEPQKGFVYTPNVLSGITTTLNIDIANNSLYRFVTNATTTINLSGFVKGKIVEVWLTNTDTGGGSNHTITHGCLANNSTIGATSFTLTSLHSAYIKYFSIDGDLANTFCQVTYS